MDNGANSRTLYGSTKACTSVLLRSLVDHVDVGRRVVLELQDVHHVHDLAPPLLLLDQRRVFQVDRQLGRAERIPTKL